MRLLAGLWRGAKRPSAGTVVFVVLFVSMMGLSILSALSFRVQGASRRRTAQRAIQEYASQGARLFADRAFGVFEGTRLRILADVYGSHPRPGEPPLAFERFVADASHEMDQIRFAPGDANRGFFVFDARSGTYRGTAAAARPGMEARIRQSIAAAPPSSGRRMEPLVWLLSDLPDLVSVGFAPLRSSEGTLLAYYGFLYTRTAGWKSVGDAVIRELPLLPATLINPGFRSSVFASRADTLVAIRLLDDRGQVLYDSRPPFPGIVGESPRGTGTTVLRIQATLHPSLMNALQISLSGGRTQLFLELPGGWRVSVPFPLDYLLPLVSLLFAAFAAVGIWREQRLTRARRDFVASVSHELRTPLAQIRMFTETLQLRRERDEEERTKWLGIVSRESRRLGDLVENILLFSHIDADRVRIEKERTDLGELIEEVVEGYVPTAAQKGMRIVADAPSRIFSLVDPRAMRQIVVNLIDNAFKYGPSGQLVSIELERVGDRARITVADEGPGVPLSDRKQIWEPFVRLGDRSMTGGSGIGLSVVRDLVHQHQGTVEVGDAPGGGARFVVDLPVSDSAEGLPWRATGEFRARESAATRAAAPDLSPD